MSSRIPISLLAVTAASIAFAIGINIVGLQEGPFGFMQEAAQLSQTQLRRQFLGAGSAHLNAFTAKSFGLDPSSTSGKIVDGLGDLSFTILWFFKHFADSQIAKGFFVLLTAVMTPLIPFSLQENMRANRNVVMELSYNILFVLGLGQIIMIGCAVPLFYVPYYAAVKISEARRFLSKGQVPPLPDKSAQIFIGLSNTLAAISILLLLITPSTSPNHLPANLFFQAFPFFFAPLVLWPSVKAAFSVKSSDSAQPAKKGAEKAAVDTFLADNYFGVSLTAAATHTLGLYLLLPSLLPISNGFLQFFTQLPTAATAALLSNSPLSVGRATLDLLKSSLKPVVTNDGDYLLIFDTFGVAGGLGFIVLIDLIVDQWIASEQQAKGKNKNKNKQSAQPGNSILQLLLAIAATALLGPGFVFAKYHLQPRELAAAEVRAEQQVTASAKAE